MIVLLVALGAAIGAPLRYLVDRAVQARHDTLFPWGTVRRRSGPSPDYLSATDRAGLLRYVVRPASAPAEAAKWSPAPTRTAARRPGPVPESLGGFRRLRRSC
ncbi:MAG: fluoride efflux transporter FluC [Pseudonocardiaceae bacterium]